MEAFSTTIPDAIHDILSRIPSLSAFNAVVACTAVWAFVRLIRMSRRVRTPKLMGPPSSGFIYGASKVLMEAEDPEFIYESWSHEYGAVYEVPSSLGGRKIILCDPKAIGHFHAKQSWTYTRTPLSKVSIGMGIGRGLVWADGESHRRQRRMLSPAFSIAAIRKLTPVFYDSAYKAKAGWNALMESGGGDSVIIDIQSWMNYISLDSVGLAGFSHDFGALEGKHATITELFDSFTATPAALFHIALELLSQVFPFLVHLPTRRRKLIWKVNGGMDEISNALLARAKQELDNGVVGDKGEKSVIGLLIKGQSAESGPRLSTEEITAQMKTLLLAGYETTSISMTWAFIELARNPDIQTKLRNELIELGSDPTYDQLTNGLPYLDAVVHEVLRIHGSVRDYTRQAMEDDVVPLSEPVRTKSGQLVENLSIAKGTILSVPLIAVNRSAAIWGEDSKVFKPSRWLEDEHGHNEIPAKAREVKGHRHLLSFSEGPRVCIGKNFAITEFKVVLSVLVKNFVFELRDGPKTKFGVITGILPRPRVAGDTEYTVPLRVKPYME